MITAASQKKYGRLRIVLPVLVGNVVVAVVAGHFWQPSTTLYSSTTLVAIVLFFTTFLLDRGIHQFRELTSIGMGLMILGSFAMVIAGFCRYLGIPIDEEGMASSFFANSFGAIWIVLFWGAILCVRTKRETSANQRRTSAAKRCANQRR